MTKKTSRAVLFAVLAAALYALNAPVSKLLLGRVPERMMAAFLYLGAGVGMGAVKLIGRGRRERSLRRDDLPYVIGMIALDIAAPILLMLGLRRTTPETAALLNNFEIVATSLIALILFERRFRAACGWPSFWSPPPARCFRWRTREACASPRARSTCCSPACAGALKTTAREGCPTAARWT